MVDASSLTSSALVAQDLEVLREIGRTKGFPLNSRREIWKRVLGISEQAIGPGKLPVSSGQVDPHRDEKQVLLDTNRTQSICFPEDMGAIDLSKLKLDLPEGICNVLRHNPWLYYYQGYHDIAQIVMIVMGRHEGPAALEAISVTFLRDFMLSTLAPSMSMLRLVHQIIAIVDPPYFRALHGIEPYYAISSLLTWWTHSTSKFDTACRMLDFLLCSEPVMILYTIAASTLLRKDKVFSCEGDSDMIFHTLSTDLESQDVAEIISQSLMLYQNIKPHQLKYWRKISKHSCLKTFETIMPSTADQRTTASEHAAHQEAEIKKEEKKKASKKGSKNESRFGFLAVGMGILALGIALYIQQKQEWT